MRGSWSQRKKRGNICWGPAAPIPGASLFTFSLPGAFEPSVSVILQLSKLRLSKPEPYRWGLRECGHMTDGPQKPRLGTVLYPQRVPLERGSPRHPFNAMRTQTEVETGCVFQTKISPHWFQCRGERTGGEKEAPTKSHILPAQPWLKCP